MYQSCELWITCFSLYVSHVNKLDSRELILNMAGREENNGTLKGDHDSNFYAVLFQALHLKRIHGSHVITFMIKKKKLIRGEKNY